MHLMIDPPSTDILLPDVRDVRKCLLHVPEHGETSRNSDGIPTWFGYHYHGHTVTVCLGRDPYPDDLDVYFELNCRERIDLFLASEGL